MDRQLLRRVPVSGRMKAVRHWRDAKTALVHLAAALDMPERDVATLLARAEPELDTAESPWPEVG